MNLAQELERLAKLHAEGALTADEFARAKSQLLSTPAFSKFPVKGIRRESPRKFFGLPLWAIAIGPDWERGEMRGHARGIFALGDMATGWFAFGGLARGFFAFGGLAIEYHEILRRPGVPSQPRRESSRHAFRFLGPMLPRRLRPQHLRD